MIRNALTCLLVASTAGFLAGQNTNSEPRVPKGIYATFQLDYLVNQAQATAYPNTPQDQIPYPNPNVTPEPTDALPDFHLAAGVQPPAPATGFADDCDTTGNNTQQQCAAVTEVLAHFTNPTVGGNNAKLVFEAGMTAARDGFDLGTNGVKWLAATSAAGTAPLPGTPYRMSRILGGLQFSHTLSIAADLQAEGCPTYPTTCPNLTPAGGLFNVMQQSFFVGTVAGPLFGASTGVTYGKWVYRNAPMNFVEIYDTDIIYASGLSQCELVEIAGNPGFNVKPDVSTCVLTPPSGGFGSVLLTQAELDLASLGLSLTDEGPAIF